MIIQRRWVGILLLLLAVAALGFGLYSLNKPGFIASFQDGSTVRLVGVTVGTNSFTSEPWWYPIARRVLPGSYRMRLVRIFSSGPHGYPNGISIWLELSGSITNKNPSTDRLSATFIDDSGDGVRDLGLSVDPVS
ncbi:MAG: hypothetical protein JWM16_770, partial [Verrucomicrobiales bacterium]|nr:hypothetical protein [Verrucomicrobiales bacterium]